MALVRRGVARMVAVTLGAEGALLATEDGVIRVPAMEEAMHSSVGAGDAFLAAAVLALARGATPVNALAWGTAAGATAIACAGTARLRRADVSGNGYRVLCGQPVSSRHRFQMIGIEPGDANPS